MPFEQRSVTYFVCEDCGNEYPLSGNPVFRKIYECTKEGCSYRDTFLGLEPFSVSTQVSDQKESFFSKIWHNTVVQGVLTGLITFIILAVISMIVANKLLADFKAELLNEVKSEIASVKGEK